MRIKSPYQVKSVAEFVNCRAECGREAASKRIPTTAVVHELSNVYSAVVVEAANYFSNT